MEKLPIGTPIVYVGPNAPSPNTGVIIDPALANVTDPDYCVLKLDAQPYYQTICERIHVKRAL